MTKEQQIYDLPQVEQLEELYQESRYRMRFFESMRSTVFMLLVVAAVSVLIAVLYLPILKIYGHSMAGTLDNGDVVVSLKNNQMETGDVMAFYYNNNVLVKRVIATSGQWVDMDKDGNVYVDNHKLDESYLQEKAYGEVDIVFPYQVPEGRIFVMGDNRSISIDSRNSTIGTVSDEQIVGKLIWKIWPLNDMGIIE